VSEISPEGYAAALGPVAMKLTGLEERGTGLDGQRASGVVEQAAGAVSVRLETTPEIAYEMLRGLALGQSRDLEEYAAAVVAAGGRLDA
jgi:AmiR/NasT family two-component response regulator